MFFNCVQPLQSFLPKQWEAFEIIISRCFRAFPGKRQRFQIQTNSCLALHFLMSFRCLKSMVDKIFTLLWKTTIMLRFSFVFFVLCKSEKRVKNSIDRCHRYFKSQLKNEAVENLNYIPPSRTNPAGGEARATFWFNLLILLFTTNSIVKTILRRKSLQNISCQTKNPTR